MKTKTLSISSILGFLGLVLLIHSFNTQAANLPKGIVCSTTFGEKTLQIEDHQVSFQKEDETGISRSISSIAGDSVRTHKKNLGFTKTLYIDGNKYQIHIQDSHQFSDANDYLSISSPKGHEMTYPLNCHSV